MQDFQKQCYEKLELNIIIKKFTDNLKRNLAHKNIYILFVYNSYIYMSAKENQ